MKKTKNPIKAAIRNAKAWYNYEILQTWEAGLLLEGVEVKLLRNGQGSLEGSYAIVERSGVWLIGSYIPAADCRYPQHAPHRRRKLLLHKSEIRKLQSLLRDKGTTLIPLEIYFSEKGMAKIRIGLAKGKREFDKRRTIQEREVNKRIKTRIHQ